MMRIDVSKAAQLLKEQDKIIIICHESPDGDTVGSGFSLGRALKEMGKKVKILCSDPFPKSLLFITENFENDEFENGYVVAVDVADNKLFGSKLEEYKEKTNLCIDHHQSNTEYAQNLLLRADAAAAAEVVYDVIKALGADISGDIAQGIYTALATDTGCFMYSNTSAHTHRLAAELIEAGVDFAAVNQRMFETKTPGRVAMEKMVYNDLEYYFDGQCAVICITQEMLAKADARTDELEGLASLPRQIEGVKVGITMKQQEDMESFKVSVRTTDEADASDICKLLGGGGHAKAAGCRVYGDVKQAKEQILAAVKSCFK